MLEDNPTDLIILGRNIGTSTGWDLADTDSFQFYGFEPLDGVTIPATDCLFVDFGKGIYETYAGDDVASRGDLLDVMKDLPRTEAVVAV